MKKIYSIALLAIMAICAISFTSCGNDDDTPASDENEFAYSHFVTTCTFSEDMFEAFDIQLEATNYDGQKKTVTVNKASCEPSLDELSYTTYIEAPSKNATMKIRYIITPKSSFTPDESKKYYFHYLILDQGKSYNKAEDVISSTAITSVFVGVGVSVDGADLKISTKTLSDMALDRTRVCTVSNGENTITTQK